MSSITWWLGIAALAFTGGIAIGFGVSWLLLPFRSQAEPGALSEWPPMLGAFRQQLDHEKARIIAEQWRVVDPTDPTFVKDQAHRERIERGE